VAYTEDKLFLIQKAVWRDGKRENYVMLRDLKNGKQQTVKFGLDPYIEHDEYGFSPIDINDDRDKVAFLAKFPETKAQQWLCIWDLKSGIAKKSVWLKNDNSIMPPHTLIWRRGKNTTELSLCLNDSVIIADTSTGKIIQQITLFSRLIRWSPDGSKLGIMDYQGSLCYYDMSTKQLIKVDENPDNFNFFWVE
jgi:hypothetical protein